MTDVCVHVNFHSAQTLMPTCVGYQQGVPYRGAIRGHDLRHDQRRLAAIFHHLFNLCHRLLTRYSFMHLCSFFFLLVFSVTKQTKFKIGGWGGMLVGGGV